MTNMLVIIFIYILGLVDLFTKRTNVLFRLFQQALITQNVCQQTANSSFVDIGKGGLPKNPTRPLTEDTIDVGLVAPVEASSQEVESLRETFAVKSKPKRKPPAQGWISHENGIVELVAYNPDKAGEQPSWDNLPSCH